MKHKRMKSKIFNKSFHIYLTLIYIALHNLSVMSAAGLGFNEGLE